MYGENKIQISMCAKGLKVFELSLSSVTHNHSCVRACVHCAYVYRSLIVLVCSSPLLLSNYYCYWRSHQIDGRWRFDLLRPLKCLPHIVCNCVCECVCVRVIFTMYVHVFYYQSNFVTESLKTWTVRTEWAHTHAHMHIGRHVHAHTDTQKTRTEPRVRERTKKEMFVCSNRQKAEQRENKCRSYWIFGCSLEAWTCATRVESPVNFLGKMKHLSYYELSMLLLSFSALYFFFCLSVSLSAFPSFLLSFFFW